LTCIVTVIIFFHQLSDSRKTVISVTLGTCNSLYVHT